MGLLPSIFLISILLFLDHTYLNSSFFTALAFFNSAYVYIMRVYYAWDLQYYADFERPSLRSLFLNSYYSLSIVSDSKEVEP